MSHVAATVTILPGNDLDVSEELDRQLGFTASAWTWRLSHAVR